MRSDASEYVVFDVGYFFKFLVLLVVMKVIFIHFWNAPEVLLQLKMAASLFASGSG